MTYALRTLLLDLNSFFASCEQQEQPELRNRPVGVVPLMSDSTCIIAASYPAKKFGIKTGTPVHEARERCPGITFLPARPKLYTQYHYRILEAVDRCVPIESIWSIDEMLCRLTGDQQQIEVGIALAQKIKRTIQGDVGECLTTSIGLSTNGMLAKLASNMQKPDGLTVLTPDMLPNAIAHLPLTALPGIGHNMKKRLYRHGIYDIPALYNLDRLRMRMIWGGVGGARYHGMLRGEAVELPPTNPSVLGHQHVLEPKLRNWKDGYEVTRTLLEKAVERLRKKGYFCRSISVQVRLVNHLGYWEDSLHCRETQDTSFLLHCLEELWQHHPQPGPHRVGIMLSDLIPATAHQFDLFESSRKPALLQAVDSINRRYGRHTITFGMNGEETRHLGKKDKIAFQRVPELYEV